MKAQADIKNGIAARQKPNWMLCDKAVYKFGMLDSVDAKHGLNGIRPKAGGENTPPSSRLVKTRHPRLHNITQETHNETVLRLYKRRT